MAHSAETAHNLMHLDHDCPRRVLGSLHTGDIDRVTCPDCLDRDRDRSHGQGETLIHRARKPGQVQGRVIR